MKKKSFPSLFIAFTLTCFIAIAHYSTAHAQSGVDLTTITNTEKGFPASTLNANEKGVITLYLNTIEIITLDGDAESVILSNPAPVDLSVESSRRLILRPLQVGVTSLTVTDRNSRVIFNKDVVVSDLGRNHVRIKRYCEDRNCLERETYFCPDGCYDTGSAASSDGRTTGSSIAGGGSGGAVARGSMPPIPVDEDGNLILPEGAIMIETEDPR